MGIAHEMGLQRHGRQPDFLAGQVVFDAPGPILVNLY
jgi:hypothetical protein